MIYGIYSLWNSLPQIPAQYIGFQQQLLSTQKAPISSHICNIQTTTIISNFS